MQNDRDYQPWSVTKGNLPQSGAHGYTPSAERTDEERVIKELSKLFAAARRRALVIVGVTVAVSAALLFKISQRPPIYLGKFQLLVEPVTTSESRLQAILTETQGNKFATYNGKDFGLDYATQIRVLKSPTVMDPIMQKIETRYKDVNSADIKVERPFEGAEGMRILEVSYSHLDPRKVQFVLEQVADGYLIYSRESQLTNLRNGIQFIESQIPDLRQRVNKIQDELQNLRQTYNLMDPDYHSKKLLEQSNFVESKRIETKARLAELTTQYATVKNLYDEGNILSVLSRDAVAYGVLIRQLQEIESQIVATSGELQDEHPTLISLREQQQSLLQRANREAETILARVRGEVREVQERDRTIAEAERVLQQQISVLPTVAKQYANLQGELLVASENLSQYLSKLDGLRIDAAQQELPWQLIAPPQNPKPSEGTTRKTKILTVIIGLILGIGTAFLLELLNNVFHSPEDIEDETKLPLLAVIPRSKELKKLYRGSGVGRKKILPAPGSASFSQSSLSTFVQEEARMGQYNISPVVESFRSLYTNIRLLNLENPIRSLVIGAATVGEGKSTVALQLAKTAATIGQRVLLVDADLRNPKIHTKLGLPNLRGLTDAISTDLSLNDAIQRSPHDDNLFVLTSGPLPQDPIKLLSSKKMYSLMEQFQDFFDLVIYDTPPLVGLADGSIIAAQTDGLALVVKLDKTDRSLVTKPLDRLKISGAFVLGIIANGAKS